MITRYNGDSKGVDNADIVNIIENYLIPAVQGSGSANPQLTDILNQLIAFTQQEQSIGSDTLNYLGSIDNNLVNTVSGGKSLNDVINDIKGGITLADLRDGIVAGLGDNYTLNSVYSQLQDVKQTLGYNGIDSQININLGLILSELQTLNSNFATYANAYASRFIVHNGSDAVATHNV